MTARQHKKKVYTSIYRRYWWKWLIFTFTGEVQHSKEAVDEMNKMVIDEINGMVARSSHIDV